MTDLKTFLAKHSSKTITNVTSLDSKWGGKWFIPRENYHEFLELYYKEILNNNYKFVEKKVDNNEIFRMFADIDISKDDIKIYFQQGLPDNLMSSIVEIYKNIISELFIIDTTYVNPIISCRANQPSKCHLQWPNLIVNNTYGKIIRDKVLALIKSFHSGDWEKWIDKASYTCTGLRMLGSLKMHERKADRYYVITGFNEKNSPQNLQSLTLDSIKNTSIRVLSDNEQITELSDAGKECLKSYDSNKIVVKAVKNIDNIPTEIINDMRTVSNISYDIPPLTKQYIERAFMNSWTTANYSPEVLESFSIGKIIMVEDYYTMLNRKKMLCPIKRDFHKRECSCNYHVMGPDGTYIKCYDEACKGKRYPEIAIPLEPEVKQFLYVNNITINNNITNNNNGVIKSCSSVELNFMEDINKISIFSDEKKDKILLKALNGGEASMAFLLHSCFHDRLHYSKYDGWWYWTGSVWRPEDGDIINLLYNEIGDKLLKIVRDKYDQLDDKMLTNSDNNYANKKNNKDAKLCQIDTIIKKLETKEYKSKIISEAEWVFAQNSKIRITQLLDTNPHLIGFMNGVYDLEKMEFRKIEYNDYISILLDYEYDNDVPDSEKIAVNNFIESIMPDKHDRHYMLKLLATGLIGKNSDELFHIFTGSGRNGKSKLSELLKYTLGDYFESVSSSFLTAKISSPNQASPHLMVLRNKRLVIGSEPDHHFKLNATIIKGLSGNDEIIGRKLYGEQVTFRPFFKMILLCNNIPEIDTTDAAVWLRCRCLTFPTSFVINPQLSHERQLDKTLSQKLPSWRLAFFHLLLENLVHYNNEGLKPTPNMLNRTREYQIDSDMYLQWLNDRTEKCDENVHTSVLYEDFKNWHIMNCGNRKVPIASHFVKGITQHVQVHKNIRINGSNKQGVEKLRLLKSDDKVTQLKKSDGNIIDLQSTLPDSIYLLELTNGKYYVGKSKNVEKRYLKHKNGEGAQWTALYPPIKEPIILKTNADIFDENTYFKKYVIEYGIENVRGDSYCQIQLSTEYKNQLIKDIDSALDQCYLCHKRGHFVNNCSLKIIITNKS